MCDRRAEDRHHGVTDELLDGAAEPFDLLFHARVVWAEPCANVFRVGLLRRCREADEVDE